ncbi:hypothetical protein MASR2M15_04050 [Anaerolineales bacterium]
MGVKFDGTVIGLSQDQAAQKIPTLLRQVSKPFFTRYGGNFLKMQKRTQLDALFLLIVIGTENLNHEVGEGGTIGD